MTTNQLFFALAGLFITLIGLTAGFFKHYIDARFDTVTEKFNTINARFDTLNGKFDTLSTNVDRSMHYLVDHAERISTLEERTKKL